MSMGAVLDMCGASCASHLTTAHLDPEPAVAHRRYRACLRGIGIENVNAFLASEGDVTERLGIYVAPPLIYETPRKPAHCPVGGGVLYGGAGYCVGR